MKNYLYKLRTHKDHCHLDTPHGFLVLIEKKICTFAKSNKKGKEAATVDITTP